VARLELEQPRRRLAVGALRLAPRGSDISTWNACCERANSSVIASNSASAVCPLIEVRRYARREGESIGRLGS
jgi:hypothetical protein